MGRLIYNAMTSLDGYTEDASGSFDWAAPSDEVHAAANDQARTIGTHLMGRPAGQALRAGLVDEVQLFLVPVIVGGGKRALPSDVRLDLELLDVRRFDSGVTFVRYRDRSRSG